MNLVDFSPYISLVKIIFAAVCKPTRSFPRIPGHDPNSAQRRILFFLRP